MKNLLVLAFVLAGCGGVRPASVQKRNIDVGDVLRFSPSGFEAGHLRLTKSTMFLWKEDLTGQDVASVSEISKSTAELDQKGIDLGRKYAWIDEKSDERRAANSQMKKLEKEIKTQEKSVDNASVQLTQGREALALSESGLVDAIKSRDEEAAKATPDLEKLKGLEAAVTSARAQRDAAAQTVVERESKLGQESEKLGRLREVNGPKIQELNSKITQLDAEIQKGNDDKKAEDDAITEQTIEQLNRLKSLVDYFDGAPKLVELDFKDPSSPQIVMQGWDPLDGQGRRTFVSCRQEQACYEAAESETVSWVDDFGGGIREVQYRELGGKVSFKVAVGAGFTYAFSFARSDYGDTSKINMSGDMTRSRAGESARYGVVKFSDSKN